MIRAHRVADRLQGALLPERLPAIEGVTFYAAYRPASAEVEVGGDWFDTFNLPDARIGISVGDVAGHGLEAAAIVAEVRPASVLEHVNHIVALRDSAGMVTAVFGLYDAQTSRCRTRWPATLRRCSRCRAVSSGASLEAVSRWAPRPRCRTVRGLNGEPNDSHGQVDDPAAVIQDQVFRGAPNRDDAAVLLLSRSAPVTCHLFSAVPITSPIARASVEREIESLGITAERRFDLLVALGEALANAIEHAYCDVAPGLIRLKVENAGRYLVMTVEDFGRWKAFSRSDVRGRGIELMHACVDSVQIRSSRDSTKIVLKAQFAAS